MAPRSEGGLEPLFAWAAIMVAAAVMITGYFLIPLDGFGPHRPVLSWSVFIVALSVITLLILKYIRDIILTRPTRRPGVAITLLMVLGLLVFSATYVALAHDGQFQGLRTRLDGLYFTVITLATVGYGDVVPVSQTARVITLLQITYNLVFLTAGATTVARRIRSQLESRKTGGS